MAEHTSKKLTTFLSRENKNLSMILAKVQELKTLNEKFLSYLDPHIRKYCQVANCDGGRLTILSANGSIATQLRFQANDLIRKFQQDPVLKKIQTIHCKVRPSDSTQVIPRVAKKMVGLSAETAHVVRVIAETLSDTKLREALQKIASHSK